MKKYLKLKFEIVLNRKIFDVMSSKSNHLSFTASEAIPRRPSI